jgi:HK97 family phage prohead protease
LKQSIERRNIKAGALLTRSSASGDGKTLVGRVAYNSRSEDLGGFTEVIAPGAFTESLKSTEVFAYWSHSVDMPLARQSNGTLRLQDTPTALKFQADLDPSTTFGQNAIATLKRGDVTANSFGFAVDNSDGDGDEWQVLPDGSILRTVRKALLFEVSPVSVPAYPSNEASLRNAPAAIATAIRERLIRDADGIADADDSDAGTDMECTCDPMQDCDEQCSLCREAREAGHTVCVRSAVNVWTWWTARVPGSPVPKDASRDGDRNLDASLLHGIITRKLALL